MFDIRKIQEQLLYDAVSAESSSDTARKIVYGDEEDHPAWVKHTMKRLEDHFDASTIKKIRMNCQCVYGMDEKLALLRELVDSSSGLEEFATHDKARAAGLSFHEGELFLQFPYCPCPMLAGVDKLETNSWCQCTTGYSKVIFEKTFGCEVDVELLKSVKMDDDICLMKITPFETIHFH